MCETTLIGVERYMILMSQEGAVPLSPDLNAFAPLQQP